MRQSHSTDQMSTHILQAAAFYGNIECGAFIRETGLVSEPSFKVNLSLQGF